MVAAIKFPPDEVHMIGKPSIGHKVPFSILFWLLELCQPDLPQT